MAEYKSIVIKVKDKSIPPGLANEWSDVTTHMPILTRDIKTPALDAKSDLTAVVSGMPTIFARANLFRLAIDYVGAITPKTDESEGLLNYYKNLVDEWRGFIACIALDYTLIEVRRIKLAYSDKKSFDQTSNIYEPKGAFGRVLFERAPLWAEHGKEVTDRDVPFIDVIKYDGNVVGAVSPESLLFTSPGYQISTPHPWVNKNTGKFTDPLNNALSSAEALTLLAYVEYIETRLNKLRDYYSSLSDDIRPDYATIQTNIRNWKEEISRYCSERQYDEETKSIPDVNKFKTPFSLVFNYSSNLYGFEGLIFDDETQAPGNKIFFDPRYVLLPKESEIARIDFSNREITHNPELLQDQPVYVLKAQIKNRDNEYAYFALPITPLGLNVFGKNIGALTGIDYNNAIKSALTAVFDPERRDNNLDVKLVIWMQSGKSRELKETYTVKADRISNKDILLWPNFISTQWNRYFLYSEMPHNTESRSCPFRATPIVGEYKNNDFRIIVDEKSAEKEPVLLAKNGNICVSEEVQRNHGLEAKLLITSDNRVADNDYKYEIYESTLPFKGVKLTSGNKDSGYLVIRYTSDQSRGQNSLPRNEYGLNNVLRNATIGVDFGSTNTSVAYYDVTNGENKGIHFTNHRISLLQSGNKNAFCRERDLFFFQGKEIEGNAIKSILTLHDPRRMPENKPDGARFEIIGGMPCFDPSLLPVQSVTDRNILLQCPSIGQVTLVYNMKWTEQESDVNNKKAFLRSLMLHIYAQLYDDGCCPTRLKWSYPSAFTLDLINQYSQIWNDLGAMQSPVVDNKLEICSSDIAAKFKTENVFGQAPANSPFGGVQQNNPFSNPQNNPFGGQQDASPFGNQQGCPFGTQQNSPFGGTQQEDAFATSAQGAAAFGNNSGFKPFGAAQEPVMPTAPDLEPDTNEVEFEFQKVDPTKCMTEAAAVANYNGTLNVPRGPEVMNLCFDVGGSTTDISATVSIGTAVTMIKQNSIRLAAQQVLAAAKKEPNLEAVLIEVCNQFGIRIPGLNVGPKGYNSDSASFYFEQVLDQVPVSGLPTLYQLISSKCPNLMAVNLYVTGLIVFYAGQLTYKLTKVIRKSLAGHGPQFANLKPWVNVMFAGKGSRIFEWFSITNHSIAQQYYMQMFIAGIGGNVNAAEVLPGYPQIQLAQQVNENVKYEVSKGLSLDVNNSIMMPENNSEAIEILGEDNFSIIKASTGDKIPLSFDNAITPQMMEYLSTYVVETPSALGQYSCQRFVNFCGTYYSAISQMFKTKLTQQDFVNGFSNMNISAYIVNTKEYRIAKTHKQFDFVAPVIILEGMKFYDDVLMKKL